MPGSIKDSLHSPNYDWSWVINRVPESVYDTVALLAADICGVPMAFLALRQNGVTRIRSAAGLTGFRDRPWYYRGQGAAAVMVSDGVSNEDIADALTQIGIDGVKYFASVPVITGGGDLLGLLAILDPMPRKMAARRLELVSLLGSQLAAQIELARRMYHEGEMRAAERISSEQGDSEQRQIERLRAQLESQRSTDDLTGVRNERVFRDRLLEEFERFERTHQPFSLIMIEVDQIDRFRSLFGQAAFLSLLKCIAEMLLLRTRYCDIVARYGEERFVAILPGTGSAEVVDVIRKLMRASEQDLPELNGHALKFGVAHMPGGSRTCQSLIEECLRTLRQAATPA